jgi:hypothetical protein
MADRLGEDERAAVGEVIAVNRGDHRVLQRHARDGFSDASGLREIQLVRLAVRDRAVCAGTRADIAEDHERRRAVMPAFADVGAARVFADRVQLQVLHDPLQPNVVRRAGGADLQPFRFRLARTDELQGSFDGHCFYCTGVNSQLPTQ